MTRTKIVFSTLLATIFLVTQFIVVGAAPATQDTTPITGTIESITVETNAETDVTTVVVTLNNETDGTQTIRLSIEDATALGLVTDDGTGPVENGDQIGEIVEIDPAIVIPDETTTTPTEEPHHPVGSGLSGFFSDLLGVDYETIMNYHDDGAGFGVIAQALWMTNALEGDSETFAAIMDAKQNKDFSGIELPDGSTPQNWGQFRKAVMSDQEKAKANLGYIMSGHAAEDQAAEEQITPANNGNAPDKNNSKDKSNNGKSDNKGNGKDKNKDKGQGKGKNK